MSDRFRDALTGAWQRIEERQWLYGHLGKMNTDESYTLAVPGRKNFVYVTIRNSAGAQTAVPARNDAAVALEARIPVKMRLEKGVYVIVSRSGRTDLGSPLIPAVNPHAHALNDLSDVTLTTPADGDMLLFDTGFWVNTPFAHNHNDIYFTEAEFLDVSAGVGDAGKPIKLDAGGQIDATMINDADIDHGSIGGLADDDHAQYHTDARGDARYSLLAHSHTLDGLSDVVITTPADGDALVYNVGSGNWVNAAGAAPSDHGGLTGLGDDDHTQYILANGTRAMTADWNMGNVKVSIGGAALGSAQFTVINTANSVLGYFSNSLAATYSDASPNGMLVLNSRYTGESADWNTARLKWGYTASVAGSGSRFGIDVINAAGNWLNAVTIDAASRVGMGTDSPTAHLHIHGDTNLGSSDGYPLKIKAVSDATCLLLGADQANNVSVIDSMEDYISWTSRPLVLQRNGGLVGIGKINPSFLLCLDADLPTIELGRSGTPRGYFGIANGNDAFVTGSVANDLAIRTQGGKMLFSADSGTTAHMTLLTGGSFGIGVSPSYHLHAKKNQNAATLMVVENSTDGTGAQAGVAAIANSGTFQFGKYAPSTTAYKTLGANAAYLYNNTSSGHISILNDYASGNITLTAGGHSEPDLLVYNGGGVIVYGQEGTDAILYIEADNGDDNADLFRIRVNQSGTMYFEYYTGAAWDAHAGFFSATDVSDFYGDVYVTGNVSALSFTDRTDFYSGNAVAEIAKIKPEMGSKKLDHSTLPEFAKAKNGERNLGNMISMLIVAIQQIDVRLAKLEAM